MGPKTRSQAKETTSQGSSQPTEPSRRETPTGDTITVQNESSSEAETSLEDETPNNPMSSGKTPSTGSSKPSTLAQAPVSKPSTSTAPQPTIQKTTTPVAAPALARTTIPISPTPKTSTTSLTSQATTHPATQKASAVTQPSQAPKPAAQPAAPSTPRPVTQQPTPQTPKPTVQPAQPTIKPSQATSSSTDKPPIKENKPPSPPPPPPPGSDNMTSGMPDVKGYKPIPPRPYDRSTNIDAFLTQAQVHLKFYKMSIKTDKHKVLAISQLLTGKVIEWFQPILRNYLKKSAKDQTKEAKTIFRDYTQFEAKL
ncbi:hypothetical protein F5Y08DRAFT_346868 [Xylaria arbuscula]|nr:hypothetical protein F5Y08DRAFT_346868 [Xylaria arbuscula]